ncbi:hypothetical protein [Deinococcus sp. 12RED42]|uniref:hypothetical protein n=1 Tax=Deinococcus sp. 12RED42 TaxID=2745872 RepID=UPI001E47A41B|nr:hypothetical protein [Deinococcus sp. 12RED42]MCD0167109.1 hypothetical protein [Deinococcus sp. 12RED42]
MGIKNRRVKFMFDDSLLRPMVTLDVLRQQERELIGELARVRSKIYAEETRQRRDPEETDRRIRALITKPALVQADAGRPGSAG